MELIPATSIMRRMMDGTGSKEIIWNRFLEASNNLVNSKRDRDASGDHTLKVLGRTHVNK